MSKPVLAPAFLQRLADYNPLGLTLTPDDVSAWFDLVWPSYAVRNYRNHKRAVVSWWSRIREDDIVKARERVARIEREARAKRIAGYLQEPSEPRPLADSFPDYFGEMKRG